MSQSGSIKKFFEDKGFGFVTPDDGSEDVFVHVKDNPDLEGAAAGDEVYFDSQWDDRKGKYKGTNLSLKNGGGGGGGAQAGAQAGPGAQAGDSVCSEGFSKEYAGTLCVGDAAWEAANGNKACECTSGVCVKCCKEEPGDGGSCQWEDPEEIKGEIDDACPYGFSRTYTGTDCAGDPALAPPMDTACECTGGTCAKCCLEEYNADTDTYKCFWEDPLVATILPPAPPGGYSPSPALASPPASDDENAAAEETAADMDAADAAAFSLTLFSSSVHRISPAELPKTVGSRADRKSVV